jgi:hypothetical protein
MKKILSKISIAVFIALVMFVVSSFTLPGALAQATSTPKCWAVIVGVSEYQYISNFSYCDDDARDLYQTLLPALDESHIKLLVNSDATKANILSAIAWLADNAGTDDTVLFSFIGYGSSAWGYICPYDTYKAIGSTYLEMVSTMISTSELANAFRSVRSGKIIIILDSCYSEKFQTDLAGDGRILMLSCRSTDVSMESQLGHSVYSYFILQAFGNMVSVDADNNYEVSAEEIARYANFKTSEYYSEQRPVLDDGYPGELGLLAGVAFAINVSLPIGTNILTLDGINYTSVPAPIFGIPGSTHTVAVPPLVNKGSDTRYVFSGWSDGDTSITRVVSKGSYTANWRNEYLLSVDSAYGNPQGAGWYKEVDTATFSVTPYVETSDTKHYFTGWSGSYTGTESTASLLMVAPATVTANWRHEYLLTLKSEYGQPTGAGWYKETETAPVSVEPTHGVIVRHIFTGWSGDLSDTQSSSGVSMNSPKVITATWRTDFIQLYILIGGIVVLAAIIITVVVIVRGRGVTA